MENITLESLRVAAQRLGAAHRKSAATAALCQEEIRAAISPVLARYQSDLDAGAEEEARARDALDSLLAQAPHLFDRPRSAVVDGVRYGYKKEPDSLDWDEDEVVIQAIKHLLPDQCELLIRTEETLVVAALDRLDAGQRRRIGVRTVTGADRRFITLGDSDVEKLAKMVLADAARRQGEEDSAPKKAKKAVKAAKDKVAA